ncbi:HAMP domain-containing sensor histidine kinase [Mangrovimonas sp. YM274]|uniref:sensor histidine kinase n=1 Tax=Mangrovimonas sp. YM274 TaxID=3070660 RepID=UPI0027DB25AB|nr:HAMP domain-containing sensor histidine kinase [Mangrovimonas sp. YM274]WMI70021.1 HAMP domain-containing sensor histidine kinase [Mangrovimonas sp. YM274]
MKTSNTLFYKIAAVLTLLFLGLAFLISNSSVKLSEDYHDEITQGLNKDVSKYIVEEVQGLFDGDSVVESKMGDLMHHVMATNPATEVYLLDLKGNILKHVAMNKEVKATSIDLDPVKEFIAKDGQIYIKGDDPKTIGGKKIFSAAPYTHDGQTVGYIYTIVGGNDYDALIKEHEASYIRKLSVRNMLYALLAALVISLLTIYLLTRNFNKITSTFREFKAGNHDARVKGVKQGEMGLLANTFNDMANTIASNIEELQSVDNLRKELIANISHDLRTPIASIRGFVETLMIKGDELTEAQKERYMEIVLKNSDKLKKLVDDLFELSKLEAEQRTPDYEPVQMAEIIQDIADKYRIIAQKKGVSINTVYSKDLPLVYADIALIDRALQNIIDNAINHCEQGDVVTLELTRNDDELKVSISDTGSGISTEELPHIFERYRKGKFLTDSKKGSGLGLAIVKRIMDLHQVSIHVKSVLNQGTEFFFSLPIKRLSTV